MTIMSKTQKKKSKLIKNKEMIKSNYKKNKKKLIREWKKKKKYIMEKSIQDYFHRRALAVNKILAK